jgi:hypothetical protein
MGAQRIRHGFECLEDIAVIIENAFVFFSLFSGDFFKIPDPGRFYFCLIDACLERFGGDAVDLRFPESVGYIYFRKIDRREVAFSLLSFR